MRSNVFIFGIAIAVGLLGGFLFRSFSASDSSGGVSPGGSSGVIGSEAGVLDQEPVALGYRSKAQEKTDLSKSVGVTRWLHWVASLEQAGLEDMVRLAGFASGNAVAREMLVARWIELDPAHLFDVASRADEGSALNRLELDLMKKWVEIDLPAAVEALRSSDAPGIRRWRMSAASKVFDRDVELGLTLFHEWRVESMRPRMTALVKWAKKDPQHAAEFVMARPTGAVTDAAVEAIGKIWAESDPAAALAFCQDISGRYGLEMGDEVLKAWSKRDLPAAADWLGEADPATRGRMAAAFVEVWAVSDADAALGWSRENLSGYQHEMAIAATVRTLAKKDHDAAAELVGSMEPSKSKSASAAEVMTAWMPDWDEKKAVPQPALEWLRGLDDEARKRSLDSACWRWVRSDSKGLAKFLTEPEGAIASEHVIQLAAKTLVREDPVGAIEWVQKLRGAQIDSAARTVFRSWHQTQPEAAMAWLADGNVESVVRAAAQEVLGE